MTESSLASCERARTVCFKSVRRGVARQAAAATTVQPPVIVAVAPRRAVAILRGSRRLRAGLLAHKVNIVQIVVVVVAASRQPLVQLGLALQRAAARLQLAVGRLRASGTRCVSAGCAGAAAPAVHARKLCLVLAETWRCAAAFSGAVRQALASQTPGNSGCSACMC